MAKFGETNDPPRAASVNGGSRLVASRQLTPYRPLQSRRATRIPRLPTPEQAAAHLTPPRASAAPFPSRVLETVGQELDAAIRTTVSDLSIATDDCVMAAMPVTIDRTSLLSEENRGTPPLPCMNEKVPNFVAQASNHRTASTLDSMHSSRILLHRRASLSVRFRSI
ncbi:UNVERIFIED_CONTAM: hypothetical protein Slati_2634200 [Sesamum latifolium]|uniref:Uncharacterized protein n=1 Tax=Sesamum latifolium TaxID=2727402 RepID=A0AAW2VTD4_9LAMI